MAYVPFVYDAPDADTLLTEALLRIADALPGWTPNEAHVEYVLLSEMTRLALDTRLLASDVADSIFRTYGEKLIGLPPQPGVPASGTAVFTLTDTLAHTIPAGTQVLWPTGGEPALFSTVVAVTNLPGQAVTPGVQIVATTPGLAANGLGPATLDLIDSLSFVASVAATTTSAGGQDPEDDPTYLDRLADSLQLLRRIPVLARDFSILARDTPGVFRALALDGYNPADSTSNNERYIAVAPLAVDGSAVSTLIRDNLRVALDGQREVNFVVATMTPTYTALTVTFSAQTEAGQDAATVLAAAIAAVRTYLSPATWGGGDERPPVWRIQPVVRYLDIAGVIGETPGVRHVLDLTLNGARVDVTLTGAAPLPAANATVTGTVTSP